MSSHPEDTPATISVPAAVLLGVAVTSVTTLGAIIAVQYVHPLQVHEGTTALLASLTALAGTGVIICAVAGRMATAVADLRAGQTEIHGVLAELTSAVEQLAERAGDSRVTYLGACRPAGRRYLSAAAVGGDGEAVRLPANGLDPETIAAARSIARKLIDGPTVGIQRVDPE